MDYIAPTDFIKKGKIDSLYRLVIVAARRASQIVRPEGPSILRTRSRKPTMIALDEIMNDKVKYRTGAEDEEEFSE